MSYKLHFQIKGFQEILWLHKSQPINNQEMVFYATKQWGTFWNFLEVLGFTSDRQWLKFQLFKLV